MEWGPFGNFPRKFSLVARPFHVQSDPELSPGVWLPAAHCVRLGLYLYAK